MNRLSRRFRQDGLTYVETLISAALIAIALVPAMDALYAGMRGADVQRSLSEEHYTALALMEQVLAEPHSSLTSAAAAAGDATTPTAFSDPPGTPGRRLVYAAPYDADDVDGDGDPFTVPDANLDGDNDPYTGYSGLTWVRVEVDSSVTSFESLVAP